MSWRRFLFSFSGRATRRDFWLRFVLLLVVVELVLQIALPPDAFVRPVSLDTARAHPFSMLTPFSVIHILVVLWLAIVAGVKRYHDRGRSGWFLLLYFVPLVGFIVLMELGFMPGTRGPNRFGPDPRTTPALL